MEDRVGRDSVLLAAVLILTHAAALLAGVTLADGPDRDRGRPVTGTRTATASIVAVSQAGRGIVGTVSVTIEPGAGRVLLSTNPFIEPDTQVSATTAKQVAARMTGVSLAHRDVIYSFDLPGGVVGGPSAGAAMTVATIAAIENRSVRDDAVVTGTVRPDGRIGKVGGVMAKAMAAGRHGLDTFLVPSGQATYTFYERRLVRDRVVPGFAFRDVRYVPRTVSLNNVTTRRFGMATESVETVQDAVAALTPGER